MKVDFLKRQEWFKSIAQVEVLTFIGAGNSNSKEVGVQVW